MMTVTTVTTTLTLNEERLLVDVHVDIVNEDYNNNENHTSLKSTLLEVEAGSPCTRVGSVD